jgi:glutamyl-tRNA synthetase
MDTPAKVRVRFAPSPTGFIHLGGIRSALFNYLYAKKNNGIFILRLEDTDRDRFVPEAEVHLIESLKWLGIGPDEGVGGDDSGFGPYIQSERLDIYKNHSTELVKKGSLYPCWCSPERLTELRATAQKEHQAFKYDRYCLTHPGDIKQPHVLRFLIPENQTVSWDDVVRGHLEFNTNDLDDFVAIKSDRFPTYQFANVVDDHEMKISHVLRADEWLPSTPKHLLLYQAFGWEPPLFAHLPAVVPPGGGKKLSKRHGAKSALEMRDEGYLQEAILNFLALLGWNEGDGSTKEIYSKDELIAAFSLERVQKSPAVFDLERLNWMNGMHIRAMDPDELFGRCKPFWPIEAADAPDDYRKQVLALVQDRLKVLGELPEFTDFFFADPNITLPIENHEAVAAALEKLRDIEFTHGALETTLRSLAEELSLKPGELFKPLRLAITGKTAAPGLFETMSVLGKEVVLLRLESALNR